MHDAKVIPIDLLNPRTSGNSQLPVAATLRERFFRVVRTRMFQAYRRNVSVNDETVKLLAHDEYLTRRAAEPGLYVIFEFPPIRGLSLVCISGALAAAMVDDGFGARGSPAMPAGEARAEISMMEARIGAKAAAIIGGAVVETISAHFNVSANLLRVEQHVALASISDPKDLLFIFEASIVFPCGAGTISIAIPQKGLEPFRTALASPISGAGHCGEDEGWAWGLQQELDGVPVDLAVEIGKINIPISLLDKMKEGDVLPIALYPAAKLTGGSAVLGVVEYGEFDGTISIRVVHHSERPRYDEQFYSSGHGNEVGEASQVCQAGATEGTVG